MLDGGRPRGQRTIHEHGLGNVVCVVACYNAVRLEQRCAAVECLTPKHATKGALARATPPPPPRRADAAPWNGVSAGRRSSEGHGTGSQLFLVPTALTI